MRVAIHQPNFFPWLGFFEKALTSDLFILLDDVQYEKSGKGNWFNRVYVSANGEKKWMSLPVNRKFAGFRNMNEIELAANMNHASDVLNRLGAFYRTSSYKTEVLDYIEGFFKLNHGLLWEMNYAYILDVLKRCGVPEERILLSSSYNSKEVATARLIDLVLRVGGGEYYSGGGAGGSECGQGGSGGSGGGGNGGNGIGVSGNPGSNNTGSGGGSGQGGGGTGGSGRVILRMLTADYSGTTTGSPSVSTSGSDTILVYSGNGSYTA